MTSGGGARHRPEVMEIRGSGVQLWPANTQTTHRLPVSEVVIS